MLQIKISHPRKEGGKEQTWGKYASCLMRMAEGVVAFDFEASNYQTSSQMASVRTRTLMKRINIEQSSISSALCERCTIPKTWVMRTPVGRNKRRSEKFLFLLSFNEKRVNTLQFSREKKLNIHVRTQHTKFHWFGMITSTGYNCMNDIVV